MANFIHDGGSIDYTPGADVAAKLAVFVEWHEVAGA